MVYKRSVIKKSEKNNVIAVSISKPIGVTNISIIDVVMMCDEHSITNSVLFYSIPLHTGGMTVQENPEFFCGI